MKLSLEDILILALVVCFFYFMYNCSCKEGVSPEIRLAKAAKVNGSNQGFDCEVCGGAVLTTVASMAGPDEVPIFGQALGAFEFLSAVASCTECGVDVGKTAGCYYDLRNDGQTESARMCTCTDAKVCPYGTLYRPLEGGFGS